MRDFLKQEHEEILKKIHDQSEYIFTMSINSFMKKKAKVLSITSMKFKRVTPSFRKPAKIFLILIFLSCAKTTSLLFKVSSRYASTQINYGKDVQFESFDREECRKFGPSAEQTQRRNRKGEEDQKRTPEEGQEQQNPTLVDQHHAEVASLELPWPIPHPSQEAGDGKGVKTNRLPGEQLVH